MLAVVRTKGVIREGLYVDIRVEPRGGWHINSQLLDLYEATAM